MFFVDKVIARKENGKCGIFKYNLLNTKEPTYYDKI